MRSSRKKRETKRETKREKEIRENPDAQCSVCSNVAHRAKTLFIQT